MDNSKEIIEYLFITDPEGCPKTLYESQPMTQLVCKPEFYNFLDNYLKNNNKNIIFCGDYYDHGSLKHIKQICKTIVNLHKKHKGKVHIILGNRDINKMRLLKEIKTIPLEIKTEHLTSKGTFEWQGGVKNKTEYYSSFVMTSSDKETMIKNIIDSTNELYKYTKYILENGKIIMTIPYGNENKKALISHAGLNIDERVRGDNDKYLENASKLLDILLTLSINCAYNNKPDVKPYKEYHEKLSPKYKFAFWLNSVYRFIINDLIKLGSPKYRLKNLFNLREKINTKFNTKSIKIKIKDDLSPLYYSNAAFILCQLLAFGLTMSPITKCLLTANCDKHTPIHDNVCKIYKDYGFSALCFGHIPNCTSMPLQYTEGTKNKINILSADTTLYRHTKRNKEEVLFIPSILTNSKFKLNAVFYKIRKPIYIKEIKNRNDLANFTDEITDIKAVFDLYWKRIPSSKILNKFFNDTKYDRGKFKPRFKSKKLKK
jgi:hypothetical protein